MSFFNSAKKSAASAATGDRGIPTACLYPVLDNLPVHTVKVWTALRVRRLPTLELEPLA